MSPSSIPPLAIAVALVAIAVLVISGRHPVQRRFAMRNLVRRPWETALVVGGSLLGAALITGSFIVGDTLDASIRAAARTQLGPIDEYVRVPDAGRVAEVERALAAIDDPRIDGVMSLVTAPAPVSSDAGGETRAQPRAQMIELDFEAAAGFGSDPAITGIEGSTPTAGRVAITEYVAETLAVSAGDPITAYLYGQELDFEVDRVLPGLGVAGFWTGFESVSPNVFVAPGTLERITATGIPEDARAPEGVVVVSNEGGVEDSAEHTAAVTAAMTDALGRQGEALRVEPAKQRVLEVAEREGDAFSELFLAIGTFAIIAGILLLVNIFVMLAEERKGQLGMLRAVGLRRSDLVRSFVVEGAMYAFVAGVLGALLGIAVGRGIVWIAAPIFGGFGEFSLDLIFSYSWASVVGGLLLGVLIAFVTVLLTSVRISRINIIRAIRDLPEPPKQETRRRTVVAGGATAVLALTWFASSLGNSQEFIGLIVGLPIAAYALVPLLGRVISRRAAIMGAAGLSLAWGIFGNRITGGGFFESGEIFAFVFQGVLLTFSAVILLSQTQETFQGAIRRLAAGRLALRLGVAYPLAHRFRTGLTLGMYSLVMFTMIFIAVLAQVFGNQVDNAVRKEAGAYDILVRASEANPPKKDELTAVEGVERATSTLHAQPFFRVGEGGDPEPWDIVGIDESFLSVTPPELEARAEGYADDQAVWRAIATDPSVAVIPEFFLQSGGGPPQRPVELGGTFAVVDPATGDAVEKTVIATGSAFPVFVSAEALAEALPGRAAPNRFYLTADGDPVEIAARLQGEFVRNGVRAESFRAMVEDFQSVNLQFMRLMQSYLALGLLVGIAGLGVVMIRSVRERRREVGVLRSLGFQPGLVRRAFTLESAFTALEGIVIGAVLALVTAEQLVSNGDFGDGIAFVIPWVEVAVLCGAALVASLAATAWPAQQASRIAPAVALRIAD